MNAKFPIIIAVLAFCFGFSTGASAQQMVDPATITVTAGSTYDGSGVFDASNLVDGLTEEGNLDAHLGTHWLALEGTFTESVTFDLGGAYDLTALKVLNTSNTGWNDSETDSFTVATSTDNGASYSDPSDPIALQDFLDGFQDIPLEAAGVTHVELVVTNDDADDQGTNDVRVGLNEVQFFFDAEPVLTGEVIDPETITATAGSTYDDSGTFDVTNLLDDLTEEGNRDAHLGTHWLALEGTFTETVTFDLGATYDLTGLQILNTSNTGWNDSETDNFTIATSTDGGGSYSDPSDPIALRDFSEGFQDVVFLAPGVTHVELVVTNEDADDQGTNDVRVGLNEVRFYQSPGADSDGDEMLDAWEREFFGDLSRDGTEDEDLPAPDGLTNKQEHDKGTDPKNADSDGDTLTDGAEVTTHHTDPNDADSDDDTLTDAAEVVTYQTDPNDADSDDDLLADGAEVNDHGTNPKDRDTDGDGLTDGSEVNVFGTDPLTPDSIVDPETITVTAGSTYNDTGVFDASNLVDGLTEEGNRDAHLGTHWLALEGTFTETVTFDLGGDYSLTALQVLNTSNTGWNDSETDRFTVSTSSDGDNFTQVGGEIELQDFTEGFQTVPFEVSGVTHVQFEVTNDDADDQGTNDVRVGLNEVLFFTGRGRPFEIIAILRAGPELTLTWASSPGHEYSVEYKADLAAPIWEELDDGVLSEGAETSFTDDDAARTAIAEGWYRIRDNR